MTPSEIHPDSAAIVAAPCHSVSGPACTSTLHPTETFFVVLEAAESAGDPEAGDAIIGLAVHQGDSYYLGCITCHADIEEAEGGMCGQCREDLAFVSAASGAEPAL